MHAIVVGGGIGGLVAARRLVLGGASVTLLEASDRLGGSVASHTVGGIRLDAGAESFARRGGSVEKLVKSLGLGDDIVDPHRQGAWLQPVAGEAFRLPELSLLGIPGSPLARDVTEAIGYRDAFRAFFETLLPGPYGAKSVTLGELVRKRMGDGVLEKLVAPIVRGVHSADPDSLPLDRAAPGLRDALLTRGSLAAAVRTMRLDSARAGSAVAGLRGGVFRIVEALVADLDRFGVDVRLGTRVTNLSKGQVEVGDEVLEGTVLLAAPGIQAGDGVAPRRTVLATLVLDAPELDAAPRGTGVLVAEGAPGITARALTHATAKWEWLARAAEGKHVVRLSYDGDAAAGSLGDTELSTVALADASTLLGVTVRREQLLDFGRAAWYRPSLRTHTPEGISVAGETIAGTGLASIVRQSEQIAADLLRDADA